MGKSCWDFLFCLISNKLIIVYAVRNMRDNNDTVTTTEYLLNDVVMTTQYLCNDVMMTPE